ncbi:MAG: SRPBCC family protein [Lewinellaceae bacterium]|nr:SRPBCC family protein [Lewinellaceae bacterium]
MKALKFLLYAVLGLLALWMLLGLFARKNYHIERSTEIDAPIELVHEQVSFFKNFKHWSPWHVYDPNIQTNIEGTDGSPGAIYTWSGNDKVGKGNQVLKSVTPTRVDLDVSYNSWGASPAFFQLEEKGKKTNITWAMDMHVPFPWNAFAMLTDVNAFVGKDFENGLVNLKKVCEDIAHKIYRGHEVFEADLPAAPACPLGIRRFSWYNQGRRQRTQSSPHPGKKLGSGVLAPPPGAPPRPCRLPRRFCRWKHRPGYRPLIFHRKWYNPRS